MKRLKKVFKTVLLSGLLLTVAFPQLAQAQAQASQCTLTIDANKNTANNPAQASGTCYEVFWGYFIQGQYVLTGMETHLVTSNGQKFNFWTPKGGETTLTVYIVKVGETKPVPKIERIAGKDRYDTTLAFASKIPTDSLDYVMLASGKDFPDALAGGPLNKKLNGTLLLIQDKQDVITKIIEEAKRVLKPNGKILLIGGPIAINQNIESQFKNEFSVERVSGKNRVETSIEIAKKVSVTPTEVFVVNGKNFADSLSIVPYATKSQLPILLNDKSNTLSTALLHYLKNTSSVKKVTLIGGTSVLDENIVNELKSLGILVERVSGQNRMETSLRVAEKYYSTSENVGIAYGWNFADALSGSRFSLDQNMPIILVQKTTMPEKNKIFIQSKKKAFLFGGESVVSNEIIKLITQ